MSEDNKKKKKPKLSWREFWFMISPAFAGTFWRYTGILFFIVVAALAQVAEPVIFGFIVDAIFAGTDGLVGRVLPMIGWWVFVFVVSIIVMHLAQLLCWSIGHRVNGAFINVMQ